MKLPWLLVAVIALGAALRAFGLFWGFPDGLHCDEAYITDHTVRLVEQVRDERSLNPRYCYGALPLYLGLLGALPAAAAAKLLGVGWAFRTCALASGRLLSVAADCGTIYLVYLLGLRAGGWVRANSGFSRTGQLVGLWGAALYAVALMSVREAHFFTVDVLVGFFMLWHVYCCVRANEEGTTRWFVWCGVTLGLALSAKATALPLVVVPAVVLIAVAKRRTEGAETDDGTDRHAARLFRGAFAALALAALIPAITWTALRGRIVSYAERMAHQTVSERRLALHGDEFWRMQAESLHGGIGDVLWEAAVICAALTALVWWATRRAPGRQVCGALWRDKAKLLAVVALPLGVFLLLNPAALTEPMRYWAPSGPDTAIWHLIAGRGALHPPPGWGLHFERTLPILYGLRHIVPYAVGWPLAAVVVVAFIWAVLRWVAVARERRLAERGGVALWPVVLAAVMLGAAFGTAHFKFSRYVVPILPHLCLFTAWWLVGVASGDARPWARRCATPLLAACWLGGLIWCWAYLQVYIQPDTRQRAARWFAANAPPGATVVVEKDDAWFTTWNRTTAEGRYEMEVLRPYHIAHDLYGRELTAQNLAEKRAYIVDTLTDANYYLVMPNNRERIARLRDSFPVISAFWDDLFAGRTGFELVQSFEGGPRLGGWKIDDSGAELTFRLFDHPKVFVFRRRPGTPVWPAAGADIQSSSVTSQR